MFSGGCVWARTGGSDGGRLKGLFHSGYRVIMEILYMYNMISSCSTAKPRRAHTDQRVHHKSLCLWGRQWWRPCRCMGSPEMLLMPATRNSTVTKEALQDQWAKDGYTKAPICRNFRRWTFHRVWTTRRSHCTVSHSCYWIMRDQRSSCWWDVHTYCTQGNSTYTVEYQIQNIALKTVINAQSDSMGS